MIQSDWTNAQEFLKMMIGNSRDVNSLQKCVLVPLAENDAHFVDVCDLLLGCLCEAVTANRGASEEETAMKRETGALGKLQDFREVMETLARRAVVCLTNGEEEGETMLRAFAQMYDVAPFALESQLETLLDDDAATILHRLGKQENEDDSAMEEEIEAINELPPLYASLSSPPLHLTPSQLISTLESIHEKLSTTDAERWNERLAALTDIECILASRSLPIDSRGTFLERLRKMPLPDQFADLRSQVTHAACRVLICTSFEYRGYIEEDSSLSSGLFQLIENCLPALMKLCTSGTKLMAVQGVKCLQNVCVNSTGHSKLLSVLCQDIVDKKSKNTNRKMGAVMGLTAALRVWDENCLKNVDAIAKAVRAANSDRDPKVREEARKAYWAMVSCDKTRTAAEEMYAERSREYRNLVKCREEVEREWDEGGVMFNLLNTGVLEAETPGRNRPSTAPSKINSNKRPVSVGKDNRVTPAAKAGRFSTPAKDGETVQSTSKRPSSAKLLKNTPNSESRRTTLAASTASKTSALKTPSVQSQRKSMGTINQRQSYSNSKANNATVHTTPPNTKESTPQSQIINQDKENTPATPTVNHSTPKTGTPIVSLLARPSPLSIEKARSRNALNQVITMLSDTNNPPEQYLAIQVLALFAKENGEHESWDKLFGVVLELLLGKCDVSKVLLKNSCRSIHPEYVVFFVSGLTKNTQNDKCYDTLHFARSPSNKHLGSRYEAQHLYLQGIRSLLQFVPNRFEEKHVKEVMICLLEVNTPKKARIFGFQVMSSHVLFYYRFCFITVHQCPI